MLSKFRLSFALIAGAKSSYHLCNHRKTVYAYSITVYESLVKGKKETVPFVE